jgi:hypothetical protein
MHRPFVLFGSALFYCCNIVKMRTSAEALLQTLPPEELTRSIGRKEGDAICLQSDGSKRTHGSATLHRSPKPSRCHPALLGCAAHSALPISLT